MLSFMEYREYGLKEAYSLLNCGGLVWVCTKSLHGRYDVAPIAWACPLDYEPVSRLLFVSDPAHATCENALATGQFAVALPSVGQRDLCLRSGSLSGRDADKFENLGIASFQAGKIDVRVPEGVAGWIECRLLRAVDEGSVRIVMGEALAAFAVADFWKERFHFVSDKLSYGAGAAL
jgi:flavin reductase (DIM6/NTAB) family NADH-FMN oxidoreductase RutF